MHCYLFAEGPLDRAGAEALFDLERSTANPSQAWATFFIASVTDHVVWGSRPTGRLDDAQAGWLIDQADACRTPTTFALLVNVLDEAQQCPSWFEGAVRARASAGWPGLPFAPENASQLLAKAA